MKRITFLVALFFTVITISKAQSSTFPHPDSLLKTEKVMPLQVGFIFPLSTNGIGNLDIYNKTSVNALVGVSKGVIGTEVSGLFSKNSGHAIGFKASGLGDIVQGTLQGFQAGGIMAAVGGNTRGFQAGGILSMNGGRFQGMQAGGIVALNAQYFEGMQAAGIVTANAGTFKGIQTAGIVAVTGDSLEGMQAAGIASVCNGRMKGLQASGIVSVARNVEGVQVGLINIADSLTDKSIQIGLVNIARKGGIMRFGVMNTEFMQATAFLKTGTRFFHGYVGVGSQLQEKDYRYGLMMGAGTSIRLANRLYFEPEWMQWFINNKHFSYNGRMTEVQQLRTILSFSAGSKGPHISAGPTINLAYSSYLSPSGERGIDLAPNYFYNKTTTRHNVNVRAWVGYTVMVSFGR